MSAVKEERDGQDAIEEWATMVLEAKQLGLSVEEVREFIHKNAKKLQR